MANDPYVSLKNSDFRLFALARLLLTIATQMQGVIVGWQILEYTKDPFWFGMIGLTEAIPFISTALFAGHVADIIPRKRIIVISTSIMSVSTFILFMFTFNGGFVLQHYGIWPIYAIIFFTGIARAFIAPSFFAFLSQIVPREDYPNATTWNSTAWQIGAITGPAIGGVLFGLIGVGRSYLTDFILILISLVLFAFIKSRPIPERVKKEPLFQSLSTGIKFVFSDQAILGALSLDLFAVLFGGAVALLPLFSKLILHAGPIGLGMLRAAPSIGAVIMGTIMVYRPPLRNAGRNMLFAVACYGVCMILFALSTSLALSVFLLALSGAFDSVSVIIRATILQLRTPDEMRGRVSSVNNIFIGSSNEIGEFESGAVAKLMGLIPSVIFGGSMTIVVVGFTYLKAKTLRSLHLDTKKE
ncbi:MAG TPA: MFS transporter [Bacteroidia bacterium]|nr:MFS transporter [Bacteroidia bacterium]